MLGATLLGALASADPVAAESWTDPVPVYAANTPTTSTRSVIGHSVRGRPISVTRVCGAHPTRNVLVVGAIHGDEDDGRPIADRLARQRTLPADVCLVLVSTMNPDGNAGRYRQNARGVDLNRNFPGRIPLGRRWDPQYSGPSTLSEPESRLMYGFIRQLRPDALLVYHQHLNLVDHCGGDRALTDRYAARTGMRSTQLPRYRGSMATWAHALDPAMTIITVELPARVPSSMITRHRDAVLDLTRRVAVRPPGPSR